MSESPTYKRPTYDPPSVVEREALIALLGDATTPSDVNYSDVHVKENIRPVRW